MRAESNIKPSAFSVEKCGDIAEIVLFENIEEKEHDGETVFVYDEYRINAPYRETLAASVEANFDGWLSAAKAHAYNSSRRQSAGKAERINSRNRLYNATRLYAVVGKNSRHTQITDKL